MPSNDLIEFCAAVAAAETTETKADALNNVARKLIELSRYDEAAAAAGDALLIARGISSALQEGRALSMLGRIALDQSDFSLALSYYRQALELFESIGDKGRIAITLGNFGRVYRNLSDYSTAIEYYHQALAIEEELGNEQGIANHIGNIGNVYFLISDYPKALTYYRKALTLEEERGNVSGIATHTGNIGNVYFHLSDSANASIYYHKALAINNNLGDKLSIAINTGNIAGVHFQLSDYLTSLEHYREALAMYEALGNKLGVADMSGNIAGLYRELDDYSNALEYYFQSLSIHQEIGNLSGVASTTNGIGRLFADTEYSGFDPANSEKYLLQSAAMYEKLGNKKDLYENYLSLSELYTQTGEWAKAYEHHKLFHDLEKEVQSEEAKKLAEQLDYERKTAEREKQAAVERAKHEATEQLLHNVLPPSIAAKMLDGATLIAEKLNNVSVLFADIVGFTRLSQSISPEELVQGLDLIFSEFDGLAEKHGLEKIKTIGDAYMVVSGAPVPRADHAEALAMMALEMVESLKKFASIATGAPIEIRIGIHTGEVVAGVIGKKKFAYDLWGDAVNTAARMESHGAAGRIHCSEAFARELRVTGQELQEDERGIQLVTRNSQLVTLHSRGEIDIRGKGRMRTYFLEKNP